MKVALSRQLALQIGTESHPEKALQLSQP
jgi:hypothetical protein